MLAAQGLNLRLSIKSKSITRTDECPYPRAKWLGRLGAWAFLFFLIKGLLWLIIPAVVWMLARS